MERLNGRGVDNQWNIKTAVSILRRHWKKIYAVGLLFWIWLYFLIFSRTSSDSIRKIPHCSDNLDDCYIDENSLRFFLIGDWGGFFWPPYYSYGQLRVAESMGKLGQRFKTHFQVSLGDNFYLTGVNDENDWRFQKTFEGVYIAKSLQTPWYILLGNHDHFGNSSAQIEYSKISKRWVMPSLYYSIHYRLKDGTKLQIVMIDTVVLCGNSRDLEFAESDIDWLTTAPMNLGTPDDPVEATKHWSWIEKELRNSRADYLFVAGHYPMVSTGDHGAVACVGEGLIPLMAKYNAQAYICGHDHNLQHIHLKEGDWKGHEIVSGAGGFVNDARDNVQHVPQDQLQFDYPQRDECDGWLCNPFRLNLLKAVGFTRGGFVFASANKNQTDIVFYRGDGMKLYQFQIKPRGKMNR